MRIPMHKGDTPGPSCRTVGHRLTASATWARCVAIMANQSPPTRSASGDNTRSAHSSASLVLSNRILAVSSHGSSGIGQSHHVACQ